MVQLQDAIINRILDVAPGIKTHANFQLQDLLKDLKIEINPKNPGLFIATLVMPTGQWIDDFYTGAISLGRLSFCTIIPTDLYIEAEVSNADQQIIRAVHRAIGVDIATFRRMFDVSLGTAIQSLVTQFDHEKPRCRIIREFSIALKCNKCNKCSVFRRKVKPATLHWQGQRASLKL